MYDPPYPLPLLWVQFGKCMTLLIHCLYYGFNLGNVWPSLSIASTMGSIWEMYDPPYPLPLLWVQFGKCMTLLIHCLYYGFNLGNVWPSLSIASTMGSIWEMYDPPYPLPLLWVQFYRYSCYTSLVLPLNNRRILIRH